ncbi:MAG: sugar ABC transporter ATP-binding protein [Christensenellales bacterium]
MDNSTFLEMNHISKSFFAIKALDDVHLSVRRGEVHALVGENGAGKSTLIKILGGIYKADSGEVSIEGKKIDINSINIAKHAGISIVHQELCLAANITVAENIFMGDIPKKAGCFVDSKKMINDAQAILDSYGLNLKPEDPIYKLTVAQQQMVEIAKAMSVDSKIVVLDEPTSSLTEREVAKLFEAIENMKSKGVAIIYISHRLEELEKIADRATILRDGKYIETCIMKEVTPEYLVKRMVGRELIDMFDKPNTQVGDTVLKVKEVSVGEKVKEASFELKRGEILGFYGLVGSGRTELMQAVFGITKMKTGHVYLEGKPVTINNTREAIQYGISLVPEDRKLQGAILGQSMGYNITLSVLKKFIKGFSVNRKTENQIIGQYSKKLDIKASSQEQLVRNLSGGNQQKVIVAKWLATEPKILIMDEPTRGIDVGAKKEVYKIMSQLVSEGVSIIMVSSELPEIINMSNRVLVMREGVLVGEVSKEDMTEENILLKATGGSNNG